MSPARTGSSHCARRIGPRCRLATTCRCVSTAPRGAAVLPSVLDEGGVIGATGAQLGDPRRTSASERTRVRSRERRRVLGVSGAAFRS